jgi:uncharacterized protein YndB with AHSA1/START domain
LSKQILYPTEVSDEVNVTSTPEWLDRRRPQELEGGEEALPRLYAQGAQTVARDRWERIVSSKVIAATPEEVWRALIDPESLRQWLISCHGSLDDVDRDCILDFEDGDFFLTRPKIVNPPFLLEWRWRWLGIGPAWTVRWHLEPVEGGTRVTVVDEAFNPPAKTGHYRGEGWPEILDILAAFIRTRTNYRWPCRSQSYILTELPITIYAAWDRLFSATGLKWWLHVFEGEIVKDKTVTVHMGDATGTVEMTVHEVMPPSYNIYPFVVFSFKRPFWPSPVTGRLFLEPAGWGASILQVYQTGWENLGPALQLHERQVMVGFWAEAFRRASQLCASAGIPGKATPWVLSGNEPQASSTLTGDVPELRAPTGHNYG